MITERERFEEWVKSTVENSENYLARFKDGGYRIMLTVSWWQAWQSAKADQQWQPIETAPHGKRILVFYINRNGIERVVKAEYVQKFTMENTHDDDELCDYDEKTGTYFLPEAWYELIDNHGDFSHIPLDSGNIPAYWMPLPPMPEKETT